MQRRKYPHLLIGCAMALQAMPCHGQYAWQETEREKSRPHLASDLSLHLEAQATQSGGKTPLWLNANRHGLSSLDKSNGYARAALARPLSADSARRWA